MKYFIIIVAAFIQTSFLPLNLVMMLLIGRGLLVSDSANLLLAFISGIFIGILTSHNIALYALLFLAVAKIVQVYRVLPFSEHFLTTFLFSGVLIFLFDMVEQKLLGGKINFTRTLWEIGSFMPIFFAIKFWEERFVVKKEIKLKI